MPDRLYKYCKINTNTLKILSNCEIYFSNPAEFNDPFDCNMKWYYPHSKEMWVKRMDEFFNDLPDGMLKEFVEDAKVVRPQLTAKEYVEMVIMAVVETPIIGETMLTNSLGEARRLLGIYCLGMKNDRILMYSHYSDSHKGLCLEFDSSAGSFFHKSKKVDYIEDYRVFDFEQIRFLTAINKSVFSKSKVWAYEDEYRMIDSDGPGLRTIPAKDLTGIIFACETPEEDKKLVRSVASHLPNVKFYEARKNETQYKLDIIDM